MRGDSGKDLLRFTFQEAENMGIEDKTVAMIDGCWWGVDTYTPANENWGGSKTLYDYLLETINFDKTNKEMPEQLRRPSFWGRYLMPSRNPLKKGGGLTTDEVVYLHGQNCKILPVYNGNLPGSSQTFDQGRADADAAINIANNLGIPKNVCIYLNVDSGFGGIKAEYIVGWWTNLLGRTSGSLTGDLSFHRAGLYCALDLGGIYCLAFDYMCGLVNPWKPWKPQNVPPLEQLYPIDRFSNIWCSWQWVGSSVAGKPPPFKPGRYTCNPRGSRVWQYTTNRPLDQIIKIGNGPAQLTRLMIQGSPMPVDLDLAAQEGFDAMY
jgi:hypothetical protein